jgi:hypothetical protein
MRRTPQLQLAAFSRDRFSAAAELGAVNWAQLISTESHGVPPCDCTIVLCRESEIEVGPPDGCLHRQFWSRKYPPWKPQP